VIELVGLDRLGRLDAPHSAHPNAPPD